MTSSTNFTFKDEKTSGTFENDIDTGSSLTIDKNVIGKGPKTLILGLVRAHINQLIVVH